MQELRVDENAIILVDHYVQILSTADHFIELGPAAGQATSPTTRESALSDLRWDGGGEPRHSISARRYDLLPRLRRYVLSKGGVRDSAHVQERGRRIFPAHTNVSARRRGSGRMPRFDDCAAPASNPPQARMRLPDAW